MSAVRKAVLVLMVGGAVALGAWLVGARASVADLAMVGTAIAAGELLELRPVDRAPLPLSFAVFTVLVRSATPVEVIVVAIAAEAVAVLLLIRTRALQDTLMQFAERCAEASAAGALYLAAMTLGHGRETVGVVLGALAAGALAPIVAADFLGFVRYRSVAPLRARSADLAIVTSGILMAVGYDGIDGKGRLGLWGPVLFAIPLVAAWYSFELLASTRRSFEQTIWALAAVPELGGLVRAGHADRVAGLATAIGRTLGFSYVDLEHLDTAARLHHLGAVCLDEPAPGESLDPVAVAAAGAEMLRASEALAGAGDVVAAEPLLHRPPGPQVASEAALAGMVLKVASAYDELTEGDDQHAGWAVDALYTGPGYVYDGRVLAALDQVLEQRGLLPVQ